ncbi:MAG TPA: hypothetical protein PKY30_20305 [Myxococcota bacterium]|nr:hypothetical protein [Myxococcota bacterium]HNH49402.1 hypothetical protein [Myxococcota bacterium]
MFKVFVQGLMAVGVVLGLGWMVLFGPHYIEYMKMDDVVKSTALTWSAFTEERARSALKDDLRFEEIDDVLIEDCTLSQQNDEKTVTCRWYTDVDIPLVNQTRRLRFERTATATKDQRLAD